MGFRVMAKPAGALCNLECDYCYDLAKRALYPGSSSRMSAETQEAYIRQLITAQPDEPEVTIAWQGGEPTIMGLDFYRRAVEVELASQTAWDQRIQNTLQTNGTMLDDAWCAFLARAGLPRRHLDRRAARAPRCLPPRQGRQADVRPRRRGLERLKRHGVQWNVLTTVHAANERSGRRVYRFLRDELEARFIQFIPIVERTAVALSERSVHPVRFGRFLTSVFDEWVARDIGVVFVQAFDTALAHWVGAPGGVCVHEPTCGRQAVLEHTGDLYACDHFVQPGFLLGNIHETPARELIDSPPQRRFGAAKREELTRYCRSCPVRFACNGGCPKDRFAPRPTASPDRTILCPGYKRFFSHIAAPMRAMADLLASGRAPAELMERPRSG